MYKIESIIVDGDKRSVVIKYTCGMVEVVPFERINLHLPGKLMEAS